jgi:hypothetical protein
MTSDKADEAIYRSKETGRDRVTMAVTQVSNCDMRTQ